MAFRRTSNDSGGAQRFIIVGLGNPGKEYAHTRHNIGQDTVELLASRKSSKLKSTRDRALVAETHFDAVSVVLAVPITFMNDSGEAVGPLCRRFKISDMTKIIVVHDELDLEPGVVRIKQVGVNVPPFAEFLHDAQRLRQLHPRFVGSVFGGERFEDVGNAHHARLPGHLFAREPFGIAFAVHAFMVATGIFRHLFEMGRPGQCFEHFDRGDDVMIDDFAFLGGERAGADGQVLDFICRQKLGIHALGVAPMTGTADIADALLVIRCHGLAADVGTPQEITFVI